MIPGSATVSLDKSNFETVDAEEARDFLSSRSVAHDVRLGAPRKPLEFRAESVEAAGICLSQVRQISSTRADCEPLAHLLLFGLSGGRVEVQASGKVARFAAGDVGVYLPGVPIQIEWSDVEVQVVCLSSVRIAEMAQELAGVASRDFRFLSMSALSPQMKRYWRATTAYAETLMSASAPATVSQLVLANINDALCRAALCVFPNTTTVAEESARPHLMSSAALRRAVAFIEEHANEPLTVSQIASAAGLSSRALQYRFATGRGVTPMAFVRGVRLERAHRELQLGDPTVETVAAIGRRWGFAKPGRFAQAYREVYGVLPSHTLRDHHSPKSWDL